MTNKTTFFLGALLAAVCFGVAERALAQDPNENARANLLRVIEIQEEVAARVGLPSDHFAKMKERVLTAPVDEPEFDPAFSESIQEMVDTMEWVDATVEEAYSEPQALAVEQTATFVVQRASLSTTLTPTSYSPECPKSAEQSAATMRGLLIGLEVAEGVQTAASRACNQVAVAVVLGNGGGANTSLACIAADAVFLGLKYAYEQLQFCEDDISKAELFTTQSRTANIFNLVREHDALTENLISANQSELVSRMSATDNAISSNQTELLSRMSADQTETMARLAALEAKSDALAVAVSGNAKKLDEIIVLLNTPAGLRPSFPQQP